MTSLAAVISKPSSRGTPMVLPPSPITVRRRKRSLRSMTRRMEICRASSRGGVPRYSSLSASAASRLCAAVTACMSPVKCRLMRSDGTSIERPPPVPPPLAPNTGPSEGSRSAQAARVPSRRAAWVRPIVHVVLPSPAGVGLMADTSTSFPSRGPASNAASGLILATPGPQSCRSAGPKPRSAATSAIGRMTAS